jgi:hypothetical protein
MITLYDSKSIQEATNAKTKQGETTGQVLG